MDQKDIEEQLKGWMDPEDLHPDLVPYLRRVSIGEIIRHPLVYSVPHNPIFNKQVNGHYKFKIEKLAQAKSEKDWHLFVFLHERPYRTEAFHEISSLITDEKDFCKLLSSVWTDAENLWQYYDIWKLLWKVWSDTYHVMDDNELKAFAALPEEITIYRGVVNARHKKGMAWTLDKDKAVWFSKRYARATDKPLVMVGQVNKDKVLAHFLGRNEKEIVVFYADVKKKHVI